MTYFGIRNTCTGQAPISYSATTSSTEMLAANTLRKGVWIQNVGTKTIYLSFGANAAELSKGVRITKDERVQIGATMLPTGAINVISEQGTQTIIIQEFV
jgi:hypothetical protein